MDITEFRHAVRTGEVRMVFQPIRDHAGTIRSVEALMRMDRMGAPVPPGEFIPALEAAGHSRELAATAIELTCAEIVAEGLPVPVSVNVPADVYDSALADGVVRALARHGLEGSQVTIEVTETAQLPGPDASAVTRQLAAQGVEVAVDDFGTGHADWDRVDALGPVAAVKLDRSLIDGVEASPDRLARVAEIVAAVHDRGARVVAEGASAAAVTDLAKVGVDRFQSFDLGRPAPAVEVFGAA